MSLNLSSPVPLCWTPMFAHGESQHPLAGVRGMLKSTLAQLMVQTTHHSEFQKMIASFSCSFWVAAQEN